MPLPADYPPFETAEAKLFFECKLEIEELWKSGEEPEAVHRLAGEHPQFSKELYLFFAFMIDTYTAMQEDAIASVTANQVRLDKPFLALLRDIDDESVQSLAASMDITPDFLVDLSDHGRAVTLAARRELVRRARVGRAIDEAEAIASFDVITLRRAASRDSEFRESNETFADIVKRSRLTAAQKRFWSNL
ncbi:MAG TPA: hypothetical protein VGM50_09940 [Gemmatimonadaceae bacterium]|jgi:hypothetical protein